MPHFEWKFSRILCAKRRKKNGLKSKKKRFIGFLTNTENQQNAAREWTEQKKKSRRRRTRTYTNKCPYQWRLTFNIQNQKLNRKHTHARTHTYIYIYQEIIWKPRIKVRGKNDQIGSVRDSTWDEILSLLDRQRQRLVKERGGKEKEREKPQLITDVVNAWNSYPMLKDFHL